MLQHTVTSSCRIKLHVCVGHLVGESNDGRFAAATMGIAILPEHGEDITAGGDDGGAAT